MAKFQCRVTTLSKLRVGQRFSWIPAEWYGPGKLTVKWRNYDGTLDIKFDAAVVNPPGVCYGLDPKTKVRILKPKKARTRRASSPR